MTATPVTAPALAAYEATAPVYDPFTSHHRHHVWTEMLEGLLRPHGLRDTGRMLDVGCGTGKSFVPWQDRGWTVVGCDASPGMLSRAAARAEAGTTTVLADARDLPELGAFDLVAMTDDVANYLAPEEQAAAFAGVRRNLAPGGLLVLDLNTVLTFRTFFAETEVHDGEGCFVVWRGHATRDFQAGDTADATLDGFLAAGDGRWERTTALHRQHHHPVDGVTARLQGAGLRVLAVHGADDDCDHGPLDELRHTKAIVIAERPR
jgi:SAM-dependent methyltransferase